MPPDKVEGDPAKDGSKNRVQQSANGGSGIEGGDVNSATKRSSSKSTRNSHTRSENYSESFNINDIVYLNDPLARTNAIIKMINELGPGDFEQVVADFRALGITGNRRTEYELLLHAWAKVDPEGALTYAKENTETPFASQSIIASWAAYNPDAALNWIKTNHEGEKANKYLVGIVKGLADKNTARATEILQELPFSRERGDALRALLPHVSKLGAEEATAWIASIKDEKLRAGASVNIARSLAQKAPEDTAKWVTTLDPETQARVASSVAGTWARQDLNKAVTWTNTLAGKVKTNAASRMMRHFVSSDPNKAATWMKSMSTDEGYEKVVRSFMSATSSKHPELALSHLGEVDENWRRRSKHMILVDWATRDQKAASTWMQSNNVEQDWQNKVLRSAEEGWYQQRHRDLSDQNSGRRD